MSFKHLQRVIEHSKTRGPGRAIMMALAFRASKEDRPSEGIREGECFPAFKTIAKDAGLARSTVAKTLPRLQCMGEIAIEGRGHKQCDGRSNRYRILLPPSRSESPPRGLTGIADSPPRGRQTVREPDGTLPAARTSDDPPPGPEPVEKGKPEPSRNREHRVDYGKGVPPDLGADPRAVIRDYPDPILVAMAVTEEHGKTGWGYWVKVLNRWRLHMDKETADSLFRACLVHVYRLIETGEAVNPGALLNMKLNEEEGKALRRFRVKGVPNAAAEAFRLSQEAGALKRGQEKQDLQRRKAAYGATEPRLFSEWRD